MKTTNVYIEFCSKSSCLYHRYLIKVMQTEVKKNTWIYVRLFQKGFDTTVNIDYIDLKKKTLKNMFYYI